MSLNFYKELTKFINKKSKRYSIQKILGLNAITMGLIVSYIGNTFNNLGGPLQLVVSYACLFIYFIFLGGLGRWEQICVFLRCVYIGSLILKTDYKKHSHNLSHRVWNFDQFRLKSNIPRTARKRQDRYLVSH